jgi:hypothetical protein
MPHKLCMYVWCWIWSKGSCMMIFLSPFNLHIWLNMSIFFQNQGFSLGFVKDFLFLFCFSEKWRLLTFALYFDECFLLWLHILTKISFEKRRLHTWLHILIKLSLPSYFNEGLFDFEFWGRSLWHRTSTMVSLASYFDEGFLLLLRILMKVTFFL